MKKNNLFTLIALSILLTLSAFKVNNNQHESDAKAKQIQGIYIFYCSEPIKETEYLGSVKATMFVSTDSDDRLNSTIKKAKKDYPQVQALVFKGYDLTVADAVKFKN